MLGDWEKKELSGEGTLVADLKEGKGGGGERQLPGEQEGGMVTTETGVLVKRAKPSRSKKYAQKSLGEDK